jgi:uncharacterized protein YhbP (UPF0306 family)
VPIERTSRRIGARRLATLARSLLDASTLCAIATVSPRGRAHLNTAYFAYGSSFQVVWISEPGSGHSVNLRSNRSVAVGVFDSHQTWGRPDRGIQLFGVAGRATGRARKLASHLYAKRFPGYVEDEMPAYVPYLFRPRTMKLFDERALGEGVFVTCAVRHDGRVSWVRTETYAPA